MSKKTWSAALLREARNIISKIATMGWMIEDKVDRGWGTPFVS